MFLKISYLDIIAASCANCIICIYACTHTQYCDWAPITITLKMIPTWKKHYSMKYDFDEVFHQAVSGSDILVPPLNITLLVA